MKSGSKKNSNRAKLKEGDHVNVFVIKRLIGQGGYGDVYEVTIDEKYADEQQSQNTTEETSLSAEINPNSTKEDPPPPGRLAMKVEMATCQTQSLKTEQHILQHLKGSIYFPQVRGFGFQTHFRYLVMDLFGPSLSNTRRAMQDRHYSLSTTLRLGVFMLQCIEEFHKHGYVHCDIKPGNFLLQNRSTCPIVLIDYGLSRKYIDPKTNEPFPERPISECSIVGTSKYMSLHVHESCDTCPRDDIISWCYSLVEMVGGKLPWRLIGETDMKKIIKLKKTIKLPELFSALPFQIMDIYRYAMKLQYLDKPDYQLLYFLLFQALQERCIPDDEPFDWEGLNEEKTKEFSPNFTPPKAQDMKLFPKGVETNIEIPAYIQKEGGCCSVF